MIGDVEECVARENAGEIVDEGGRPRGPDPALALDGVADGARQRGALDFGLHQNVLRAFAEQSIREVFVRLVGQNQDGRARGAGATSRNESSSAGLSGRLRLSRTASNELATQAIQRVGQPIDGDDAGGAPVGPLAILFNFEQRFESSCSSSRSNPLPAGA